MLGFGKVVAGYLASVGRDWKGYGGGSEKVADMVSGPAHIQLQQ
ncbi:hypothetical protein A2U01_0061430, partial [Trifolium medium]|nr:hypothetical protein [Trifolium medium]